MKKMLLALFVVSTMTAVVGFASIDNHKHQSNLENGIRCFFCKGSGFNGNFTCAHCKGNRHQAY